eukprot:TRINITY_DN4365_c0_g1_i6.p1 TRINITY_DN4365_c0_g1~~TRINITY_DN4365_c0_g1_i6.p1  ORF type:complete len:102 (-),score=19.67 TRINITY_DN4365_c0_g1_i6:42-347(-)
MKNNRGCEKLFCTGDLNASPRSEIITRFGEFLKNSSDHAELLLNASSPTFHGWRPNAGGGQFIDYIFFGENCTCKQFEVIIDFDNEKILASDHRPIIASFI